MMAVLKKRVRFPYKEEFELNDFVRKAGKKYLVNLTGLMGSQLQIKKEERSRKYDIDVRYPKTYAWYIQFKVPPGYKIEGLTELNKAIDNETGSFKLSAKGGKWPGDHRRAKGYISKEMLPVRNGTICWLLLMRPTTVPINIFC